MTWHATQKRKLRSLKVAGSAELYVCLKAPAQGGRAKRGGCLRFVQHEIRVFYLMFAVCLDFLRFDASLAREPIGQYRRFEIETLGWIACL